MSEYPSDRTPHVEAASFVLNGKLWIAGGTPGSDSNNCKCEQQATADVDVYDPAADTWSSGPKINHRRFFYPAAVLLGDTVYLLGGSNPEPTSLPVEKLAPPYDQWVDVPNTSGAKMAVGSRLAFAIDGKIVAISDNSGPDKRAQAWIFDAAAATWTAKASGPHALGAYAPGAAVGSTIYVLGGLVLPENPDRADILAYDVAADTWSKVGVVPGPAIDAPFEATASVLDGKVVVHGGDNAGRAAVVFDPVSRRVERYDQALVEARSDHAAGVINGNVYLVGGIFPGTAEAFVSTIEVRPK